MFLCIHYSFLRIGDIKLYSNIFLQNTLRELCEFTIYKEINKNVS